MNPKYVRAFMETAKVFAQCSTAERLKVGCIAVKSDRIISIGLNGTPNGWDNNCENPDGSTKQEVLHAESNMITKLARSEGGAEGAVVFITHSPCIECAKLLYQCGIKKVYYESEYRSRDGLLFLEKAGVSVEKV